MDTFRFVLGAIVPIFLLSKLISYGALRKTISPKRNHTDFNCFLIATVLAAYGLANGDDPKFAQAAI